MGWKKNNPGDPCCVNCVILEDTFDRADSTSLGSDWDERSGDWNITSNTARCSSANSLMVSTVAHPDSSSDMLVKVNVQGTAFNDVARAVVAYTDDNNYLFGQVSFATTNVKVRLGKVVAGVSSFITSEETVSSGITSGYNTTVQLKVCYFGTRLGLNLLVDSILRANHGATVTATGTGAGIALGAQTGSTKFETFEWERHSDDDRPNCDFCTEPCVYCTDGTTPYAVQVEFTGIVNGVAGVPPGPFCIECEDLNDVVILLTPGDEALYGPCVYIYLTGTANPGECTSNIAVSLCDLEDGTTDYWMFGIAANGTGHRFEAWSSTTCNNVSTQNCDIPNETVSLIQTSPVGPVGVQQCQYGAATAALAFLV